MIHLKPNKYPIMLKKKKKNNNKKKLHQLVIFNYFTLKMLLIISNTMV